VSAVEVGDEPLLIARKCPGITVMGGASRAKLALKAAQSGEFDILLLDDGFQHRQLHRDIDIVVLDASAQFGNGHLLPRGPLREPPSALSRANLLVIRGTEEVTRLDGLNMPRVDASFKVAAIHNDNSESLSPHALKGRAVVAVCGLARPGAFFQTLERLQAHIVARHAFPDHYFPDEVEILRIEKEAEALGAIVVTTEKDRVRWPTGSNPPWTVEMQLRFISGLEKIETMFRSVRKEG
jgi:tetraacyldisaccharide 4'-kinase